MIALALEHWGSYPARWIGHCGSVAWPPRSPDLNPRDFFFWGCEQDCIYSWTEGSQECYSWTESAQTNVLVGLALEQVSVKKSMYGNRRNTRASPGSFG
ncbi:hypothetical protein AVEN_213559-1 [Araneus ventricosus]|uniref:Uncharacterized protein n=1 Tax=Araneus ventricosus TaxID=182803 RepID=A0A4Y2JKN6_ARAVE|nr:hypothetical protein AVEN_213559-1 [Araneus ventricosus]